MICTCEGLSYPHTSNRTFLFKCARWSIISGTATFNTPCATPSWRPIGFVISGMTEWGSYQESLMLPLVTATLDLAQRGAHGQTAALSASPGCNFARIVAVFFALYLA
jgi:hypothetical protein